MAKRICSITPGTSDTERRHGVLKRIKCSSRNNLDNDLAEDMLRAREAGFSQRAITEFGQDSLASQLESILEGDEEALLEYLEGIKEGTKKAMGAYLVIPELLGIGIAQELNFLIQNCLIGIAW
jgi:ribosomal protein L34